MTKLFLSSISLAFIGSGAISTFFIGAASAQSVTTTPAVTATGTEAVVTPAQYNPAIDVHAAGDGTGAAGEAKVEQASTDGDNPFMVEASTDQPTLAELAELQAAEQAAAEARAEAAEARAAAAEARAEATAAERTEAEADLRAAEQRLSDAEELLRILRG